MFLECVFSCVLFSLLFLLINLLMIGVCLVRIALWGYNKEPKRVFVNM